MEYPVGHKRMSHDSNSSLGESLPFVPFEYLAPEFVPIIIRIPHPYLALHLLFNSQNILLVYENGKERFAFFKC